MVKECGCEGKCSCNHTMDTPFIPYYQTEYERENGISELHRPEEVERESLEYDQAEQGEEGENGLDEESNAPTRPVRKGGR